MERIFTYKFTYIIKTRNQIYNQKIAKPFQDTNVLHISFIKESDIQKEYHTSHIIQIRRPYVVYIWREATP